MQRPKTFLILLLALAIVGTAIYIHEVRPQSNPISHTQNSTESNPIFSTVNTSLPSANWTTPVTSSEQTMYGTLTGQAETGQITTQEASMTPFEDPNALTSLGYEKDVNLDAGGPGSAVWGYKKTQNGKSQVIIFSYRTQGTSSPNEPIQFNCPCKTDLKVFVSDEFNEK